MKRKIRAVTIILIMAVLLPALPGAPKYPGWQYWKSKKGVTLYKRKLEKSGIIEVRGETVNNAAPEVLESIIRDIPAYPQFMYECIIGREIKRYDDENIIILNVTKMPWPLKPRSVVVRTRVKKDFTRGKFSVALVGLPKGKSEQWVPPVKGRVRMHELTGTFICEILERHKCRVTYIVHANPKGIPNFIVNLFVDDNPYGTLRGIKRMAGKQKYIKLGKNSKYLPYIEKFFAAKK